MNINNLIIKIKEKLNQEIKFEELNIEDKTFLHKNHQSHEIGKFHLKIIIKSHQLKKMSRIEANKKIFSILDEYIKKYIHSISISIL